MASELAPETLLRDLEAIAREVDTIADPARQYARRQRLLIELDTAGVLDEDRVAALASYPHLAAYHAAATALRAYLRSPARAEALPDDPPPANVLDSRISLDWFRRPGTDRGRPLSRHAFLAGCERAMLDLEDTDGVMFAKFAGATHELHYRREVANAPRLFRAGDPAPPDAPLTVSIESFRDRLAARDLGSMTLRYVAILEGRRTAAQEVAPAEHEAWLDALDAAGIRVGALHGSLVWVADDRGYLVWRGSDGVVARGTRDDLADAIGILAQPERVAVRRRGARIEPIVEHRDRAANVACARELARWRGVIFADETT